MEPQFVPSRLMGCDLCLTGWRHQAVPQAPVETLNSMISDLASFIKSRPRLGQEPSRQEAGGEGPLPFLGRGVAADGAHSGQNVSQCKDSSYAIGDVVQTPSKGVAFSVLSEAPSGGEGPGGLMTGARTGCTLCLSPFTRRALARQGTRRGVTCWLSTSI